MTPAVEAVLFDLFGTLVGFDFGEYDACAHAIGCLLDAQPASFAQRLHDRYHDLETGALALPEYLAAAATAAGAPRVDPYRMGLAVDRWRAFQATQLRPWSDAPAAIEAVQARGLRVALVSNAPPPVHELWPRSPLGRLLPDAVFSNLVGVRKPHPGIYLQAAAAVGVPPECCLFVGDGSSGELSGARAAGMQALQVRRPADPPVNDLRFGREAWDGPTIPSLHLLPRVLNRV